jgi:hypothetical protein
MIRGLGAKLHELTDVLATGQVQLASNDMLSAPDVLRLADGGAAPSGRRRSGTL